MSASPTDAAVPGWRLRGEDAAALTSFVTSLTGLNVALSEASGPLRAGHSGSLRRTCALFFQPLDYALDNIKNWFGGEWCLLFNRRVTGPRIVWFWCLNYIRDERWPVAKSVNAGGCNHRQIDGRDLPLARPDSEVSGARCNCFGQVIADQYDVRSHVSKLGMEAYQHEVRTVPKFEIAEGQQENV